MEFKLSVTIKAPAELIYKTWLNSKGHREMTGSEASISDQVGTSFSAWDGYISGENLELETNKRIIQTWRTTEFKKNQEDSLVEIELIPNDKLSTKIVLTHTNLSDQDEHFKKGWKDFYFIPMKKYFEKK